MTNKTNRENAKHSTGPRTAAGKSRASRNATTHGFFARELALNDEETRQLETIRRALHAQLRPKTPLQVIKFGLIAVLMARCKLGLRLEMRYIARALGQDSAQQAQPDQSEEPVAVRSEWYLSGKQGLREGMSLLEDVKREFLNLGRIDEGWHAPLDTAFGPQLRQLLTQWMRSNKPAFLLAQALIMHADTYKMPLPPSLVGEQGSAEDGGNEPKVILDPEQSKKWWSSCSSGKNSCWLIFGGVRNSVLRPRPGNKTALWILLATSARRVGISIVPSRSTWI